MEYRPGDVIGFVGFGKWSVAIQLGCLAVPFYSLSHVGIIGESEDGRLLLFESTDDNSVPCAIQKRFVNGTQAVEIEAKLASYPGKVYHYPLYRRLYDYERQRLTQFLTSTLGINYDTIGAMRSGGRFASRFESLFTDEDFKTFFCSEWVAAAHREVGIFPTNNASKWNPSKLMFVERWKELVMRPILVKDESIWTIFKGPVVETQ